jgi:hypothetical protein
MTVLVPEIYDGSTRAEASCFGERQTGSERQKLHNDAEVGEWHVLWCGDEFQLI